MNRLFISLIISMPSFIYKVPNPSNDWVQIYDFDYEINSSWQIRSYDKHIIYESTRRGTEVKYFMPAKLLKYDIKEDKYTPLVRVQLYKEKIRYCFYVGRLVYTIFNWIDYNSITKVSYIDWNSLNLSLSNLKNSSKVK